jgi:hypothetical protein
MFVRAGEGRIVGAVGVETVRGRCDSPCCFIPAIRLFHVAEVWLVPRVRRRSLTGVSYSILSRMADCIELRLSKKSSPIASGVASSETSSAGTTYRIPPSGAIILIVAAWLLQRLAYWRSPSRWRWRWWGWEVEAPGQHSRIEGHGQSMRWRLTTGWAVKYAWSSTEASPLET